MHIAKCGEVFLKSYIKYQRETFHLNNCGSSLYLHNVSAKSIVLLVIIVYYNYYQEANKGSKIKRIVNNSSLIGQPKGQLLEFAIMVLYLMRSKSYIFPSQFLPLLHAMPSKKAPNKDEATQEYDNM